MKVSTKSICLPVCMLVLSPQATAAEWSQSYMWGQQGIDIRCSNDSLSPAEAAGRINWSLTQHPQETAEYWYYLAAGDVDFTKENRTLEGVVDMVRKEWLLMPTGEQRPRPIYPLWAIDADAGDPVVAKAMTWRAPVDPSAPAKDRADAHIRAKCTSSCYKPEVRVFFPDGYHAIVDAVSKRFPKVVALSESSTFENLKYKVSKVAAYSKELQNAQHDIASIRTRSGGRLDVTLNHPLVDGTGVMREAHSFKVGDALVRSNGQRDTIVDIRLEKHFGQVYNLRPEDETLLSQIVVAEGFLSGSAWYQNDGANNLNRDVFRLYLPESLVE